ncbi:zinc ABC transporter substrate-binding protein ZnuA [Stutzerimonas balearica]|uniref:High-affinity zinc uptake system protein ZnuA n=1 Tax=Stutzerimonas balearica DSM 6083 TaxID=1123016 RepID=A0A8D3Y4U7_9GAMM|nr:zinc ABC transporter substrate-binding protein ZnuA [Stutzerimonas balearica]AJE17261.1 ABC transporter substrate-binding protein [Stutzerimonas balearica DSM 6083]SDM92548.1 zinc transport system substrate-binding protein [Stutzerimonas balearica DSM 6083]
MKALFSLPLIAGALLCTPAAHADVRLLTSIKPLQLIAAAVQDGAGQPEVLLPPGASAHHYALRPSDVRAIRDAELFYWVGPDLESFLPRVLEGRDGPSVAVQDVPGMTLRHFGEAAEAAGEHGDDHDHDHDHDHDAEAMAGEHDHDHRPGSLDAHLWLLPANARAIAERMAEDLAARDPQNAPRYQANLVAFEQRLETLDRRLQSRLAKVADKPYFVFHEAYDYFEAAYGLSHAGVFAISGEAQPGARHVAAMRERLKAAGPSCVFSEPPVRPRLAETLTAGLPVTLAELDVLGVELQVGPQGYEQLLERLADNLAGCLESLQAP